MPSENEIQRLAAMAAALRPDWPASSVATLLRRDLASRPYADVAVALAAVAADPTSGTPARVRQPGPWWTAAQAATGSRPVPDRFPSCPDHRDQPAGRCRRCEAMAVPPPADLRGALRERTRSAS